MHQNSVEIFWAEIYRGWLYFRAEIYRGRLLTLIIGSSSRLLRIRFSADLTMYWFPVYHFRCMKFKPLVIWIWYQNIAISTIVGTSSHINESFDCRKTTLHEYCDFLRVTKIHFWLYFLRERFPLHVRRGHSPTTIHIFTSRTSCTDICFTPLTTSGILFLGVVPSRRKSRSYFCSPHDKWNHFLTQIIDTGN